MLHPFLSFIYQQVSQTKLSNLAFSLTLMKYRKYPFWVFNQTVFNKTSPWGAAYFQEC